MAFPDPLVLQTDTFHRINVGEYIKEGTTIDEPTSLVLKSTLKATGASSFVLKFARAVNVLGGPDDVSEVYLVVRGNFATLTDADIRFRLASIKALVDSDISMARLRRGEL